jgi:hypothetical protein
LQPSRFLGPGFRPGLVEGEPSSGFNDLAGGTGRHRWTTVGTVSYSECQDDGFWHVVEDAYYACPPDNRVVRYRVADRKTEQRCTEGMEPPTPAGLGYQLLDPSCQSPADTGQKIVLMICTNGHWAEATYLIFRCLDGNLRLSGPVSNVPAMPPTRCSERPPQPHRP